MNEPGKRSLVFVDSHGWPVEGLKGKPITTIIRKLLHTKSIMTYGKWKKLGGCKIVKET